MKLGEMIKAYRHEHKISQRQFALRCNVSNGYISMLENGKNPKTDEPIVPSITILKSIASAMSMSLNDLLTDADDMPVVVNLHPHYFIPELTKHEIDIIQHLRLEPEMYSAVDRLLRIDNPVDVPMSELAPSEEEIRQQEEEIKELYESGELQHDPHDAIILIDGKPIEDN